MALVKWMFIAAAGYAAFAALMYFVQRSLMYFPETARTAPAAAGLPQAQEVVLDTADGEKVIAWHVPPRGDAPTVLYFHGNGGSLRLRADRFQRIAAAGVGLVALSYRGYGGSTGKPTEEGLINDARAAYAFAADRYPRIALWASRSAPGSRSRSPPRSRSPAWCSMRPTPPRSISHGRTIGICRCAC